MEPSPLQKAIYNLVETADSNIMVQACAGSGKTTTLRGVCDYLDPVSNIVALCFNKLIAEQFQAKLPGYVQAKTMHSLGYQIIKEWNRKAQIDKDKERKLCKELWGSPYSMDADEKLVMHYMRKAASLCLGTMVDPEDSKAFRSMLEFYGMDIECELEIFFIAYQDIG